MPEDAEAVQFKTDIILTYRESDEPLEPVNYERRGDDWPPAPLLYGTDIIGEVRWAARTF